MQLLRDKVKSFDQFPFTIPAIRTLDDLPLDPGMTFFLGENGTGKSTLVEAIAIAAGFNPEGGNKNLRFAARPSESNLHSVLRLVRQPRREGAGFFLRAESMFNLATQVEEQNLAAYGWEALHERSHGEAFLWVVQNRFPPRGLYIMDEPESALSPQRELALLRLLVDQVRSGSQFIIATHSPILLAYPRALLYELGPQGISQTTYEDTEHYTITRAFLQDPNRMLRYLLDDGE